MKILLLRQDRLGDLLISTGIIRNLRQILPNSDIHILLGTKNHFANHILDKYIDKFYLYDKKLLSSFKLIYNLRKEKYDYVIDLFDNPSKTSELIIKLINAKTSVGLEKSNSHIYNKLIELKPKSSTHIIDRVANLITEFTSINLNQLDFSPEYNYKTIFDTTNLLNFRNKNNTLLINLFGSNDSKFWGVDNHIYLIYKLLKESKYNILISTTKDRKEYLEQIFSNIENLNINDNNRIKIVPFNSNLDYIACVISNVDLVITPDTSIVHISAAFKVKCIVLYPDTEETYGGKYWTPYKSHYVTLNATNGDLTSIKVIDVFNSIVN